MDNKDFFDEEFERVERQDESNRRNSQQNSEPNPLFDSWNSYQANPTPTKTKNRKGWLISLVCLGVVLCMAMGWFLCALFQPSVSSNATDELWILEQVMNTIDNDLYPTDMANYKGKNGWSQAAKNAAIAAAGTAMLQTLGDKYSRLMSPEQYAVYTYGASANVVKSPFDGLFGIQFSQIEGLGLSVSSVVTDGAAYGRLQEGDIVYKFTLTDGPEVPGDGNIEKNVCSVRNGAQTLLGTIVAGGTTEVILADYTTAQVEDIMSCLRGARFGVLRNGKTIDVDLWRGVSSENDNINTLNYVEYYFGRDNTNLGVNTVNLSPKDSSGNEIYHWETATSAYAYRHLDMLPDGVGYVRLTEFSGDETDNVDSEFVEVMKLFKASGCNKLVLDLKGNPGGNVLYATNLAGRLTYNFAGLKDVQNTFTNKFLMTTLVDNKGNATNYYSNTEVKDFYDNYVNTNYFTDGTFDTSGTNKSIVVWTDGNSASASELVTGALKDYGVVEQMGTTTYGKGIAQTIKELTKYSQNVTLNNGMVVNMPWAVYYTVDKYYTPADSNHTNNLHGKGLTPAAAYNGLTDYQSLWQTTKNYWGL